ncbi:MAG: polyprenol monophosphomannose synthase [Pirellulales bacterium]
MQHHDSDSSVDAIDGAPTAGRLLVAVATYNEIENLPRLIEEIFQHLPQCEVLVIDDNSPDGTGRWCDDRAADEPRLQCLHRAGKLGLGTAVIAAFQYAIEHGYDYLITMDADFSHHPRYLRDLLAGMNDDAGEAVKDCMIGSRYVPGGGIEGWPLKRHLMSKGVNTYARLLLSLPIRDCSGNFRCYRVEQLKQLDFDAIISRGYSFQEEVLWHLHRAGTRFGETPITFVDRLHGTSKINAGEAKAALAILFKLGWKNWTGRRPSEADKQT